ncbi:MAG: aldehyde dehydrogenase family protein [Polyangiaceae bacterium]|nr:aldehyde dehydrogenase family protein [Polyangiaceae bacterium]
MDKQSVLAKLGIETVTEGASHGSWLATTGPQIVSENPATGRPLGALAAARRPDGQLVLARALERFAEWRLRPAPRRAELVRRLGELLRRHQAALGELFSVEVGKIRSEGLAEVQEMIDICDFAVGLGRQLYGLTMPSERPRHRMFEQWHPLGPVGIITAFNFPGAVWAWNAALAAVCGDVCLWKPSPLAPLSAVAIQELCHQAMRAEDADGVFCLLVGDADVGKWMAEEARIPLVSFTGSIAVGRSVGTTVAARLGRSILELGGNNAVTVLADAPLDLAVRGITFGAVGTTGQRCTSTRRVFADRRVATALTERLVRAFASVRVGDPLEEGVLAGPLVSARAVERYEETLALVRQQGGEILVGGQRLDRPGHFVAPTLVRAPRQASFPIAWDETFAPIVYLFEVESLEQALTDQNAVTQGLSSAIFTDSLRAAERFLSATGSDCGIANVNLGTSGAEIGGAFGGEKDTGGGREAGSDAWKAYMRRQTCTVNWGDELPLAQGVDFPVD